MDIMELIGTKYGMGIVVVCILVVSIAQLLLKIGEFLWELFKEKQQVSDKTMAELTFEIKGLRGDIRRSFTAIKLMAGDKWPEIRKEISEDDKFEN